jgi:hypothetical protein
VFTIAESELNDLIRRLEVKKETANRGFVRIRGLPYSCKKEDITRFFQGFYYIKFV